MMPCPLIINTLTDVLLILFLESFCMFLYNFLYVIQLMFRKAAILGQFNFWLQPKLGLMTIT